jgi:hypothetical protein
MANGERANATHKYVDKQDDELSVSLKVYVDKCFDNLKDAINAAEKAHDEHQEEISKALDARFQAQEKAIAVATAAHDKRLDAMNEFRETLRDQNKTFITQVQHDALATQFNEKLEAVKVDMHKLELSAAVLAGKASQSSVVLSYVFTVVTLIVAIASLVLRFAGK